jgi:hypothetical protein
MMIGELLVMLDFFFFGSVSVVKIFRDGNAC